MKNDGSAWSCGNNDNGQLGLGGYSDELYPVLVPNITGVKKIIAQGSDCFILTNGGDLYAAGENAKGQFGLGDNNFNKLGAGIDVTTVTTPFKMLYTYGMKTVAIGESKLLLVLASNSTPIVNYVSKAMPNFEFMLYDEDLVSCDVYLNDALIRTITSDLTSQIQVVNIIEENIIDGRNSIKIVVKDSDGNVATSETKFDKNPVNIETGCCIIYKDAKYVVTGITNNDDGTVSLQLNRPLEIAAFEGDNIRLFNDAIEVKCECDGSGNNVPMNLVSISDTNRNTIKEVYELDIECRTFAPNIIINKSTKNTKISRITMNCTYKED